MDPIGHPRHLRAGARQLLACEGRLLEGDHGRGDVKAGLAPALTLTLPLRVVEPEGDRGGDRRSGHRHAEDHLVLVSVLPDHRAGPGELDPSRPYPRRTGLPDGGEEVVDSGHQTAS